jgi:hypothetical protein
VYIPLVVLKKNNYKEFVQAVDQLLKVRQGSIELRRKLGQVNDALQTRGTKWEQKVHAR